MNGGNDETGTGDTERMTTQERHDLESQMNKRSPSGTQAPPPEVTSHVQTWKQSPSLSNAPKQNVPPRAPQHQPPSKEELSAWMFNDILRIVPKNLAARRAMHGLLDRRRSGTLSDHHTTYLTLVGRSPAEKKRLRVQIREGDSEGEEGIEENEELLNDGYFRIGLDCQRVSVGLKWTVGRGGQSAKQDHRNVDVLLAPPDSAMARPTQLGSNHIVIDLDPGCGAWKIVAREGITFEDKELQRQQQHALYRPKTTFEVNRMLFQIQFAISDRQGELRYLACRDQVIQSGLHDASMKALVTNISGIPFESDILLPTIVFRHGIGAGSFNSCYEGFDPTTGHARVAKWIEIKKEEERQHKLPEVMALHRLGSKPGIVKVYGIYNSLNGNPLSRDPTESPLPLNLWIVMEKGMDFRAAPWDQSLLRKWRNRVWLAKRLLMGLKEIHAQGFMHRDITRQNVLLHYPPLDATLCDFGKVFKGDVATEFSICGANLCPPEITQYQYRPYKRSVDIFLLGQVFAMTWFPEAFATGDNHKVFLRTHLDYGWITKRLFQMGKTNGLADLILSMIQWKPEDRITAAQALRHWCFDAVDGPADEGHLGHGQKRPAEMNEPAEASKGGR